MSNCFADFLKHSGLYDSFSINESNINELCDVIGGKIKLSEYCFECKEMRVFIMEPISFVFESDEEKSQMRSLAEELVSCQRIQQMGKTPRPGGTVESREWYWTNWQTENATRIMVFPFVCAMDADHHLDYIVRADGNALVKIGQYPSFADLSFPELDEFKKEIDKASMKEFRRAIGLHAQGIGVGSYVYLRRIFERILEEAKRQVENDQSVVQALANYDSLRVSERIKLLKGHLPDIVTSNPSIYGIVSKGIHELNEDECIKYFPVLQEAIFMILRQWSQKRKEQDAIKKLEASISSIATELS